MFGIIFDSDSKCLKYLYYFNLQYLSMSFFAGGGGGGGGWGGRNAKHTNELIVELPYLPLGMYCPGKHQGTRQD